MATSPTDRGYAVMYEDENGYNVAVCTRIVDGRPQEVFAVHMRVKHLDVDSAIEFDGTEQLLYSTHPVAVYGESGGVVHVKPSVPENGPSVAVVP